MNEIKYTLKKDEVKDALYLVNMLKDRKVRTIVEISICAVLFIISMINVIVQSDYKIGYVIMAAAVIVIIAVIFLPKMEEKHIVDNAFNSVNAEIDLSWQNGEDAQIRIQVMKTGADWKIDRQNINIAKENENLAVLVTNNSRMVVIPKRVFENGQLDDFRKFVESLQKN